MGITASFQRKKTAQKPGRFTSDNRDTPTATRAYRRQNRLAVQAKTTDGRTTRYPKRN